MQIYASIYKYIQTYRGLYIYINIYILYIYIYMYIYVNI